MPRRLIKAFRDINVAATPTDVVDVLDAAVAPTAVKVLGVWPARPVDDMPVQPQFIIYGPQIPPTFRQAHQAGIASNGASVMALAAFANPPPFTFSEFTRREQPRGHDRWIFDLLKMHGMPDGLYCAYGNWLVVYGSPVMLRGAAALTHETRRVLTVVGGMAVGRLKELMVRKSRKRGTTATPIAALAELAVGEIAVLRHLSQGRETAEIAALMGLTTNTVKGYVRRAEKKLNAKNQLHVVAIALRNHLI